MASASGPTAITPSSGGVAAVAVGGRGNLAAKRAMRISIWQRGGIRFENVRRLTIALESRSKLRRGLASFGSSHHLTHSENESLERWLQEVKRSLKLKIETCAYSKTVRREGDVATT